MNIIEALNQIQTSLSAPKSQYNKFGGYSYRSCEDILEAAKGLLKETGCVLLLSDDILQVGDRFYVKATATLRNKEGESVSQSALAREPLETKGQNSAQVTGATSSYARKYALNGLLCIDDCKDPDATNDHGKNEPKKEDKFFCDDCGSELVPIKKKNGEQWETTDMVQYSKRRYNGKVYCPKCMKIHDKEDRYA